VHPEISVVLPVYRNRASLPELHQQLTAVLEAQARPYELLFVDDACPEDSLTVLRRLAGADERVAVLALARNVGQNQAILVGLAWARGQVAVLMDADLQDPPVAIPLLLDTLSAGAAAVFAGRRGQYESRGRLATSRLFKGLLHLLSLRRLPADAGLFVAMRREMVDHLLAHATPDPYVLGLMARSGLPLASVPVERAPAPHSSYTPRMRARLAMRALATVLGPKPQEGAHPQSAPVTERIGARFNETDTTGLRNVNV
jgi:dolichol-phosphate mannosyltransferase/undecaprenyl-phosphate 4-deoxy-4-formamido-L-arabinose transferase